MCEHSTTAPGPPWPAWSIGSETVVAGASDEMLAVAAFALAT